MTERINGQTTALTTTDIADDIGAFAEAAAANMQTSTLLPPTRRAVTSSARKRPRCQSVPSLSSSCPRLGTVT